MLVGAVFGLKLAKIERKIWKEGLHRDLQTDVDLVVENNEEFQCSLVFRYAFSCFNYYSHLFYNRETTPKDIYIYLEEVEALKGYEFWPHLPQDVEKPASTALAYEYIWRLPVHANNLSWVSSYQVETATHPPYKVHLSLKTPFHFRY